MATFIKGNAIGNATGYELYKVNGDEGYIPIVRKVCGEVKFTKQERIGTNGAFQATANYWMRSDFIDVTDLADNEDGYCAKVNGDAYPDYLHIAFYTEKDNTSSFVGGNYYGETTDHQTTLTAETIKTIADGYGAKYVVIASDTQYEGCEELLVTITNEINFRLDDLGFEAGTHQLVVKAIAPTEGFDTDDDGEIDTIYVDSDYGGGENGEPLVYTVKGLPTTLSPNSNAKSYIVKADGSTMSGGSFGNLEYDLTAGSGGTLNIETTYTAPSAGQYENVVVWALFSGEVSTDTLLTPVGPDAHDGITTATIDLSQYPTATKLRVFGIKATMADTTVVTHTA